jgi:2-C-methyl-D-erythritol 4-phosphate cytidylyltransferase
MSDAVRNPRVVAIIAAGGQGTRLGAGTPKQFLDIGGRTMLELSVMIGYFRRPALTRATTAPTTKTTTTRQTNSCHGLIATIAGNHTWTDHRRPAASVAA